ncbi:hypothetical protein KKH3_38270 [Pectobacterium actinidiae]|nr:hypothetical protein KKH3_38270 [Pectobacterium actinidiae]
MQNASRCRLENADDLALFSATKFTYINIPSDSCNPLTILAYDIGWLYVVVN